jgi:hypothetical protein
MTGFESWKFIRTDVPANGFSLRAGEACEGSKLVGRSLNDGRAVWE